MTYSMKAVLFIKIYALLINHQMEQMFYYLIDITIILITMKQNVNQIANFLII